MRKAILFVFVAAASAVIGPSPAIAQTSEPMFVTHMYSDASHTTEVGQILPQCTWRGVQYTLVGTYTYFQVDEQVGNCPDEPIE
jgi:hypothetical protein